MAKQEMLHLLPDLQKKVLVLVVRDLHYQQQYQMVYMVKALM